MAKTVLVVKRSRDAGAALTRRCALGAVAFMVLFALSAMQVVTAQTMPSGDANCRRGLGTGVRVLSRRVLKEMQKCERAVMLGDLPATVNCDDLTQLPASSIERINLEKTVLKNLARAVCAPPVSPPAALGYAACPPPCDTVGITDYQSVATCLACRVTSVCPAMNTDVVSCQGFIDKALGMYMSTRIREQQSCQYQKDLGMVSSADCMTADLNGRIARAMTTLQEQIGKRCIGVSGQEMADSMFTDVYEPQ
jgi:hypothetical protein